MENRRTSQVVTSVTHTTHRRSDNTHLVGFQQNFICPSFSFFIHSIPELTTSSDATCKAVFDFLSHVSNSDRSILTPSMTLLYVTATSALIVLVLWHVTTNIHAHERSLAGLRSTFTIRKWKIWKFCIEISIKKNQQNLIS